jgi:hypothetical protein
MYRIIIVTLLSLYLTACADTQHLIRQNNQTKLPTNASIYVSVPEDGRYGLTQYNGSGRMVSQVIRTSFSIFTNKIEISSKVESSAESLANAKSNNAQYLIAPTILQWEDRATEWSGIPDRVIVKIDIIDALTDKIIDSATITGKSGLGTMGGDHPQDLLPKPMNEYASSLFRN